MGDNEGSAFVRSDNSLWLADDNKNTVYAVDPTTGALKRTIPRSAFINAPKFGGGPAAGTERTNDFESIAYNRRRDVLYVFSGAAAPPRPGRRRSDLDVGQGAFGSCHTSLCPRVPTTRLPPGVPPTTSSTWGGMEMRSFNYATGSASAPFGVDGIRGILGMDFGPAGGNLFVTVNSEQLIRIDWARRTVVSGWTFDLTPFGVRDARAVAKIRGRFFVSDGSDLRSSGDPLRHAVFVLAAR